MDPSHPRVDSIEPRPSARSGLAAAALVMGILGMIACPPVGIVAVVTGTWFLIRTPRSQCESGQRGMALAGMICGAVGGLVIGPMLTLWVVSRFSEGSKRMVCGANLQELGLALRIYVHEYPDQGLPTLEQLVELDFAAADRTKCPSCTSPGPHYAFRSVPGAEAASNAVIAFEFKTNHGGLGGNILFNDGHAKFTTGAAYDALITHPK